MPFAYQNSSVGSHLLISKFIIRVYIYSVAAAMERPRTERIAFRMQSEIEIVDDGYKWRKYGKKSVKNSPNPR